MRSSENKGHDKLASEINAISNRAAQQEDADPPKLAFDAIAKMKRISVPIAAEKEGDKQKQLNDEEEIDVDTVELAFDAIAKMKRIAEEQEDADTPKLVYDAIEKMKRISVLGNQASKVTQEAAGAATSEEIDVDTVELAVDAIANMKRMAEEKEDANTPKLALDAIAKLKRISVLGNQASKVTADPTTQAQKKNTSTQQVVPKSQSHKGLRASRVVFTDQRLGTVLATPSARSSTTGPPPKVVPVLEDNQDAINAWRVNQQLKERVLDDFIGHHVIVEAMGRKEVAEKGDHGVQYQSPACNNNNNDKRSWATKQNWTSEYTWASVDDDESSVYTETTADD